VAAHVGLQFGTQLCGPSWKKEWQHSRKDQFLTTVA